MSTLEEILTTARGTQCGLVKQAVAAAANVLTSEEKKSLLTQTVDEAVAKLRRRRNSLSDRHQNRHQNAGWCFTQLDTVMMPLLQLQRDTDMDVLGPYPSSHAEGFDVLISDVKPEDLPGRISQALGVQYLAEMQSRPTPVNGIVFNTKSSTLRMLVTLPVSARGRSVAVHFIFDTGAPCTYVALSVLEALSLPEVSLCSEAVKINGVKSVLSVSDTTKATYHEGDNKMEVPCHFVGLNILGMDFLDRAGIKLEMDLATNAVVLSSPQFPVIG